MSELLSLNTLYFIFPLIIASMVPLTMVAMGALYSERSGVVNIALEGIMVMGGFVGVMVIRYLEFTFVEQGWFIDPMSDYVSNTGLAIIAIIGLFIGALAGMAFSFFHAFASIRMKSNQIISATALNLFAPALAVFVARTLYLTRRVVISGNYRLREIPGFSNIPFIGDLLFKRAYVSTYISIALFVILTLILYKTRLGLRIRSCGENPHAADSLGVNVAKIRYIGVLVSGAMAGMGGVIFVLSFATRFDGTVIGFGFLSLAVLIFGQWRPARILFAAFFFAMMRVIASTYSSLPVIQDLPMPRQIYSMLPYIATLVVLAFVSKRSQAPRAAGEPYDAGKR